MSDKRSLLLSRLGMADGGSVDEGPASWDPARLNRGQTPEKWRARQAQMRELPISTEEFLGRHADALTGLAHGAVGTAFGWPGDLEKLLAYDVPGLLGADKAASQRTFFPTSEEVRGYLPKPTQFQIPYAQNPGVELGQWAPITPGHIAGAARSTLQAAKAGLQGVGGLAAATGLGGSAARRGSPSGLSQLGAVRLRGGNFDDTYLDSYLDGLTGWRREGAAEPVSAWIDKTLRNYLKKDLGTPTDPLLQVEKELPGLHLPPDWRGESAASLEATKSAAAWGKQGRPGYQKPWNLMRTHAELTSPGKEPFHTNGNVPGLDTEVPLTPWGLYSGQNLRAKPVLEHIANEYHMHGWEPPDYLRNSAPASHRFQASLTPSEQALKVLQGEDKIPNFSEWAVPGETDAIRKKYGWALKDPDAKVWGFNHHPHESLGFEHVRDYLNAATEPHIAAKRWWDMNIEGSSDAELIDYLRKEGITSPETALQAVLRGHSIGDENAFADRERWHALNNAGLLIDPAHIPRTSVADAVRKTAKWNEFLANQDAEVLPGLSKGIAAVHKEYPEEGMRWVRLGSPDLKELPEGVQVYEQPRELGGNPKMGLGYHVGDPSDPVASGEIFKSKEEAVQDYLKRYNRKHLEEGLNAEGDAMGHCVGGYCDNVASRGVQIYSLRDAQNRPHVTVEVRKSRVLQTADDVLGKFPELKKHKALVHHAENDMAGGAADEGVEGLDAFADFPGFVATYIEDVAPGTLSQDLIRRLREANSGPESMAQIHQIKGKQNTAPVKKYLPFVQDFVKSGEWGRVGDLSNAGLIDATNRHSMLEHPMFNRTVSTSDLDGLFKAVPKDAFPDRFLTHDEFRDVLERYKPDEGYPGFASGGSVKGYTPPELTKRAFLLDRI